uniref:Uncharacterized protein n=1 Tax=Setaria italica TaxID=4555 RepID=K4A4K9_SETIT
MHVSCALAFCVFDLHMVLDVYHACLFSSSYTLYSFSPFHWCSASGQVGNFLYCFLLVKVQPSYFHSIYGWCKLHGST